MDGDFGDFNVGLLFIPLRPLEDRDNGDVLNVRTPVLLFTLLFLGLLSVADGNSDVAAVSVASTLTSTVSSASSLTGGSFGTRLKMIAWS